MELLKRCVMFGVLGALALIAGCRGDRRDASATTRPAGLTPEVAENSADLMEYVGNQPYVTAEAGYRAVYALWKFESHAGSFEQLRDTLREGRIISRGWNHAPDDLLTRADVGYMVCRATNIRTGLNWQLTGLGRYAWRELIYREIAAASSEANLISGGEFLGVITRADEYSARRGKAPPPNLDLGPRPD